MSASGRRALITGAAGFAGRHLIAELLSNTPWDLIGLTRKTTANVPGVHHVVCDLQNEDLVRRTISHYRPDVVFHLAAQSYVPKALAFPADTIINNTVGQINLLEAIRAADIDPTILIVGSSEVYGFVEPHEMPVSETQPFRPGNPYAVSKVTQDVLGYQYFRTHGMKIIRVRPFNHFGPGQSDRFVLSSFARQVAQAEAGLVEPTVLTGDLGSRRDFSDVRDIVRAYRLAVERGEPGEVYNLCSGIACEVGALLSKLLDMATVSISVEQDPSRMRPSDVPVIEGDYSRFNRTTGWTPQIPVEDSLQDTLNYWRNQLASNQES